MCIYNYLSGILLQIVESMDIKLQWGKLYIIKQAFTQRGSYETFSPAFYITFPVQNSFINEDAVCVCTKAPQQIKRAGAVETFQIKLLFKKRKLLWQLYMIKKKVLL